MQEIISKTSITKQRICRIKYSVQDTLELHATDIGGNQLGHTNVQHVDIFCQCLGSIVILLPSKVGLMDHLSFVIEIARCA